MKVVALHKLKSFLVAFVNFVELFTIFIHCFPVGLEQFTKNRQITINPNQLEPFRFRTIMLA